MRPTSRIRKPVVTPAELHRQWLELVDVDGPFLAIPPLKRVWPTGIPAFRTIHPDRFDLLMGARKDFELAWETFDRAPTSDGIDLYRASSDTWIQATLRDAAGWAESLEWGAPAGIQAHSPNRTITITPHAALVGPDGVGAIVLIVDPTDSLRQTPSDGWAATPIDRMEALLRQSNVRIGIVTDGRWWALVSAGDNTMAASGVVDALTWIEEPLTRDAFLTLIDRQYLIGGDPAERLPILFAESVAAAEEITEALGGQVRRAVELLVRSFSESATELARRGQANPLPARSHDTYEAAVTVMMRVVFLLFAEERGLLPAGDLFEQGYGISRELAWLSAAESEEALDATSLTWHRLLATSQALFGGVSFENARMPAYGGSVFDPSRFPFLAAVTDQGTLAVAVSDRVMLHVLRSVQVATVKGEARQISFRDIDVEQIGYIYEGLLGYTCVTVSEAHLGIFGTSGSEPQVPLTKLEELRNKNADPKKLAEAIVEWMKEDQPSSKPASVAALVKALKSEGNPSTISALNQLVSDQTLREQIKPWLGLVRLDLRGYPFVVTAGGLTVKETPSRKNAGAHYTPKSLAEEVVLHALQPLCYSPGPHQTSDDTAWKLKSSDEILDLKVADIACGSGAFLVAAARYLADRVVEAWLSEDPNNAQRKHLSTRAIRQVVANCLYGADINDMAVEMCKLSLWLVSLDSDLPFSFVDDKVFVGNSLLGLTSLDQLQKLHIDPMRVPVARQFDIFDVDIDAIIRKAVDVRERLTSEIDENDPARSSAAKQRQLSEFRRITTDLRRIADGVVAVGLAIGGKPGRELDEAYDGLRLAVQAEHSAHIADSSTTLLETLIDRGLTPTVETDYERWQPIHWVLETPDIMIDHGGFDAIVGNPPFLGGLKLTSALGIQNRDWLVWVLASGVKGAADLVSYFLLRAQDLLRRSGVAGLIAKNTIANGDSRLVGLDQMLHRDFDLFRAVQSAQWPARGLDLRYAAIWGAKSELPAEVSRWCDGVYCSRISSLLEAQGRCSGTPFRLLENQALSFVGCVPMGNGFFVSPKEVEFLAGVDPKSREVIYPFLTGEDLNERPDSAPTKLIIDFDEMSLQEASTYSAAFERVNLLVRPGRSENNRSARRERWWRYAENASGLRRAVRDLHQVIGFRQTSTTLLPVRITTRHIFDQTMTVVASESFGMFAVLSSSIHNLWVTQQGVLSPAGIPRYTPSDVFETFPQPAAIESLDRVGRTLDSERREIMLRRNLGLTKLYNLVHNPEILDTSDSDVARIRSIHLELDHLAMGAYGWADVRLGHGFHLYRQIRRWTVCPTARVEILDRLLEENHRRAAEEAKKAAPKKTSKSKKQSHPSDTLFS